MSYWKEGAVRARLARQGAEQRETPPARKKEIERPWLLVNFGIKAPWQYVRAPDGSWVRKHENDPPHIEVRSRHRTEADARRELEKHEFLSKCFIAHVDVYQRLRVYWT